MDWRRLSALDVDHVAREMDVVVLQEYISAVTFCDVTGNRAGLVLGSIPFHFSQLKSNDFNWN